MTIPASDIVSVTPSVIGAGGSTLNLNGLILSPAARVPIGAVQSFPSVASVISYFGAGTNEALAASAYFGGFEGSNVKPGSVLFAQYPTAAVGAFLRGGSLASLTLAALQALSGTLILTVAGTVKTSSNIVLSGATSFSNAATIIAAAFTTPGFTVAYDSVSSAFIFSETVTGVTSTLTFATGTLSAGLVLTAATGAVLSQGSAAAVPATFMAGVTALTTNWVSFMTLFDPDAGSGNALKLAFAAWNAAQGNRYLYACWDTDVTPAASNSAATSLGYMLGPNGSNSSGIMPIYAPDFILAAFVCGSIASLDFTQLNGRATLAFRLQSGLSATVTTQLAAANLRANGYNYYGAYATAAQNFTFLYPGSVTGQYLWADSYINQVWLNARFQLALMTMLTSLKSIPYNSIGYALIRAACMDPINAALNFGVFRAGVPLSSLQAANVNNAAGVAIDGVLSSQGWYLQILPAAAITRAARATPPCTFWYMDGGSVQQINLASIEVL